MTLPTLEFANADFVTGFLAVGGDLSPRTADRQADDLVRAGVTHILDVRLECHDQAVWSQVPQVDYRWAGIDDAGQQVPGRWFEAVTTWAEQAVAEGGTVLTHCHMGVNRGPSAGYAVLLRLGHDPVEALAAIRAARPIAAVAYAEDALAWHLDRTGATREHRARTLRRVADWRRDNPLDVVRIIRGIRAEEAA